MYWTNIICHEPIRSAWDTWTDKLDMINHSLFKMLYPKSIKYIRWFQTSAKFNGTIDLTVHFEADKGSDGFLGAIYSMLGHLLP